MAAGFPETQDKITEQFLNCSICMEQYRNARLLPCSHSFCEECLVKHVGQEQVFACPLCAEECCVPVGGVSTFKPSVTINGIIELMKDNDAPTKSGTRSTTGSKSCEICLQAVQINRCIECALCICKACSKAHGIIPATSHHRLLNIEEYEYIKDNDTSLIPKTCFCETHSSVVLTHYCTVCEVPVCSVCLNDGHARPGHISVTLCTQLEKLDADRNALSRQETMLHRQLSKITSKCCEQARKIRTYASTMRKKLSDHVDKEEKVLLDTLKSRQKQSELSIQQEINKLQSKIKMSKARVSALQSFMPSKGNTKADVPAADKPKLVAAPVITTTPIQMPTIEPPAFYPDELTVHGSLGYIQSNTSNVSSTAGSENVLDACELMLDTTTLTEEYRVGETVYLSIRERRHDKGNIVVAKNLKGVIVNEADKKLCEKQHIQINNSFESQGKYRTLWANFQCKQAGKHTISVCVNGIHIQGSPYTLNILPEWKQIQSIDVDEEITNVSVDQLGNILLAHPQKNKVEVLDIKSNHKEDIQLFGFRKPFTPTATAVANDNTYLFTDKANHQVVVLGKSVRCFGEDKLSAPSIIAINENVGYVYVVDKALSKINKMEIFKYADGSHIKSVTFSSKDPVYISSLVIDSQGIIFICFNQYVQRYDKYGEYLSQVNLHNRRNRTRSMYIGIDRYNNMYLTDRVCGIHYDTYDDEITTTTYTLKKFNDREESVCVLYFIKTRDPVPIVKAIVITKDTPCKVIVLKESKLIVYN